MTAPALLIAQAAPGFDLVGFFLPLLLVFVVFYFFIIRPQQKRDQQHKSMIDAVKKGDKIVTIGGLHGKVVSVDETTFLAEVDTNTKLRFDKKAIATVDRAGE